MYSNPIMFHNGPVNNTWHYLFNDTVDLLKILNKNFKCRLILNVGWAYLNHIQYSFMIHNLTFIFLKKIQMYQFDCESIIIFIYRWRHCDQHLCAWLLTLVTRRHVTVTWLWRGHGDSVTAPGSNPSQSGGIFAVNQVKIITVLRNISMFFSKQYPYPIL